ncbi:MAG TPA: Stp1/IreP family PP2C-type Ser/Thr phosphatase [Thermomicrobiaceae bacterium]|nr:Stp1/IreP family PP2C-type Ser/Thr phosphatase [Thermomicrobiaceae bacterium]
MRLAVGAASETGTVREQNEDTIYVADPDAGTAQENGVLLAVADGMGGYQRGEVASRLAIDTLQELFYQSPIPRTETPTRLKQAFRQANDRIFEDGSASGEANMMGTTLVAAVIRGHDLTIANVGDSRAYLVRANRLTQISQDHSLVAEQVAAGTMTEQEARESQHRNIITRALGHRQRVDVDVFEIRLLPDDRLILSSDGLHDYLDEGEMVAVSMQVPPEKAAQELVTRALQHESNDNVSAVVAWMAPAGVPTTAAPEELAPAGRGAFLVPVLVLIGLLVFVAIVGVILFMGH